jgi:hypothetical protein
MIKTVCLVEANADLPPTASMTKMYPNYQQNMVSSIKHQTVSILAVPEYRHT